MKSIRVIPRLDIKGPNLVKGIHLEGLRVIGSPSQFALKYYEDGADELFFMDVVASLYERNSLHDIIRTTCKDIFIPITVGGGVRSVSDIRNILNSGADKVAINTAAVKRPEFIQEASREFGCSTIVGVIEAIKQPDGQHLIFTDNGREETGIDAVYWAKKLEELGAGEVIVTSVDRDGTGLGFDIELISKITAAISLPVIAHGGSSNAEQVKKLVETTDIDAVAIASALHYRELKTQQELSKGDLTEGNREFLKGNFQFKRIHGASIADFKHCINTIGYTTRKILEITE